MTMHDDDGLDALLAEARRARPPAALVARVLADAEAARPRRRSLAAALLGAIGGWPSAAGLAAASAAGLLIGYAAPDALLVLAPAPATTAGYDLIDLAPGYGAFAALDG